MHRVFRVIRSGAGFRPGPIWSSRLFGGADRLAGTSHRPRRCFVAGRCRCQGRTDARKRGGDAAEPSHRRVILSG